eukprot:2875258-Pleurochrysis_carterae.AAC.1
MAVKSTQVLAALDKLDEKATLQRASAELHAVLDEHGKDALPVLLPPLLNNLKRPTLAAAPCVECVRLCADCMEEQPAHAPLSRLIRAVVAQLNRSDGRVRDACAAAFGRMAAAAASQPSSAVVWGSVPGQKLAPFFSELFPALRDPERQEGAAQAIAAVLRGAAADDVAMSMRELIPRLAKEFNTTAAGLGAEPKIGALAHTLGKTGRQSPELA